jgi:hypothetical protein
MDMLKEFIHKYSFWPAVFACLILLTIPPILIHYATSGRTEPKVVAAKEEPPREPAVKSTRASAAQPAPVKAAPTTQAGPITQAAPTTKAAPKLAPPPPPSPVVVESNPEPIRSVRLDRLLTEWGQYGNGAPLRGYHMTLDKIDTMADGHCQWHFTAWNKTTEKIHDGVYKQSYITDENGEKYPVEAVSGGWTDNRRYVPQAGPGEKRSFWLEFPAPKSTAEWFTLNLSNDLRLPPVQIQVPHKSLPKVPPAEGVAEERVDAVAKLIQPGKNANTLLVRSAKNGAGAAVPYVILIEKIELMSIGDVRIHLTFWNQSSATLWDRIHIPKSKLVDEKGRDLPLVGSSLGAMNPFAGGLGTWCRSAASLARRNQSGWSFAGQSGLGASC